MTTMKKKTVDDSQPIVLKKKKTKKKNEKPVHLCGQMIIYIKQFVTKFIQTIQSQFSESVRRVTVSK